MNPNDYKIENMMFVFPTLNQNIMRDDSLKRKIILHKEKKKRKLQKDNKQIKHETGQPFFDYIKGSNINSDHYKLRFKTLVVSRWLPFYGKWRMKTKNEFLRKIDWNLQKNKNGITYYLASSDLCNVSILDIFNEDWNSPRNSNKGSVASFANEVLDADGAFATSVGKPQIFMRVKKLEKSESMDNLYNHDGVLVAQRTYYDGNNELFFYVDDDGFNDNMFWMSNFVNGIDSIQAKIFNDLNKAVGYTHKTNKVNEIEWVRLLEDMKWKYAKRNNAITQFTIKGKRIGLTYEYLGAPAIRSRQRELEKERMKAWIKDRILVIQFNEKAKGKRNNLIMMIISIATMLIAIISIFVTNF